MDLHAENGIVIPTLKARGFILRPMDAGDRDVVVAALNQWSVTQWLTRVPYPYGADDFDWFLNTFIPSQRHIAWAIDAGDGIIGSVSVGGELGYWMVPEHHGHGHMTRAATVAVDWHISQTGDDLLSGYHLGNGPSSHILTKLGFQKTHIQRAVETARGDRVDIQRMALRQSDWAARHD